MHKIEIPKEKLINWRRRLHMHPELAGEERDTAQYISRELAAMGLQVTGSGEGYGLVATLPGQKKAKCVAFRADMDALPVVEQTGTPYCSLNQGVMHACGHDAHMAILLGVAEVLTKNPPVNTIKFIFQPHEEKPPGGAKKMIEAGVLSNPTVDAVFGLHVSPDYPTGTIALKSGVMMAIADDFQITIRGKGGHGALPHITVDTITVAAQVILALQNIVSRRINPVEPVVISVGSIHGGFVQNVIADEVIMTGTIRCLNEITREHLFKLIRETLAGVTKIWQATYEFELIPGYPPVVNDPELVSLIKQVSKHTKEVNAVVDMEHPLMAGEDFSYFGTKSPAAFFFLGCKGNNQTFPWHHSKFDIDEDALIVGCEMLSSVAYNYGKK